jgi:hypothetical protein
LWWRKEVMCGFQEERKKNRRGLKTIEVLICGLKVFFFGE